jgi:hypothetical protein
MKNQIKIFTVLALVVSALLVALPAMANTTVTGEVSEAGEIVTDSGTIYVIEVGEKGDELAAMVGETVKVTGTLQESEGIQYITVASFTVIKQQP